MLKRILQRGKAGLAPKRFSFGAPPRFFGQEQRNGVEWVCNPAGCAPHVGRRRKAPQECSSRPRLHRVRPATSSTSLAWNVLQHNIVAATYAHVASVCRAGLRGNACPFCPVGYGTWLCGCVVVGYGSKRISLWGCGDISFEQDQKKCPHRGFAAAGLRPARRAGSALLYRKYGLITIPCAHI